MKILVTGASSGIGRATANLFINKGHEVIGFDIAPASITDVSYEHYKIDVSCGINNLPELKGIDVIVNNAGVQNEELALDVNLQGAMDVCEKYGYRPGIKSIVNVCSTSAHTGAEFTKYTASKGGLLAYTKNLAQRVAQFGATCNSISPGGVITPINQHIINDAYLYDLCKDETLLHKWATANEIADWIYFLTVQNKSMTGQDIIVDNGEMLHYNFIW